MDSELVLVFEDFERCGVAFVCVFFVGNVECDASSHENVVVSTFHGRVTSVWQLLESAKLVECARVVLDV